MPTPQAGSETGVELFYVEFFWLVCCAVRNWVEPAGFVTSNKRSHAHAFECLNRGFRDKDVAEPRIAGPLGGLGVQLQLWSSSMEEQQLLQELGVAVQDAAELEQNIIGKVSALGVLQQPHA